MKLSVHIDGGACKVGCNDIWVGLRKVRLRLI